tara:strand:+ start:1420 stop:2052 length:633 start_codon:yes stop_codon:yes gene_type:complete
MAKKAFMSISPWRVTVNPKAILENLTVGSNRAMTQKIRGFVGPQIEKKQDLLVKQFEAHPITIEIDAGPTARNSSGTLGGYGNLFSFIGFPSGSDPTAIIKQIFNEKIKFKVSRVNKTGKYKITCFIPTLQEIYGLTPLPWAAGKSWVDGIEKGMSNVGQFLYSSSGFGSSRAGTGIQAKRGGSRVSFQNTPYVAKLIENFKRRLKNINL